MEEEPRKPESLAAEMRRIGKVNLLELEAHLTSEVDRLRQIIEELAIIARGY